MFRKLYNGFLNFILPNTCLACDKILDSSTSYLCPSCYGKLEPYKDIHPWQNEKISEGIIDNSFSAFWFREGTPVQLLFHSLKYKKIKSAGSMLGEETAKRLPLPGGINFDMIIPVPLHNAKLRERTYNQSEYIAGGISSVLNIPVVKNAVHRNRFTPSQTRLNKAERRENVAGAFEVSEKDKNSIAGKNLIVCDDVITTGATILECASALKAAGAGYIIICSAAYAELKLDVVQRI